VPLSLKYSISEKIAIEKYDINFKGEYDCTPLNMDYVIHPYILIGSHSSN
jgi:hypothetical protein